MNFIVQGYPAYAYTGGRPFDPTPPTIVFVHGAACDHSAWQWQSRHLAHHGFGVLAADLPGHGRSPGAVRATVEAMAAAVATCRGMRRCSVSSPCRIWNAVVADMHAPKSRSPSRRARSRKAVTGDSSVKTMP